MVRVPRAHQQSVPVAISWVVSAVFYILPPLVALVLAAPAASTLAPWNWRYVHLSYSHFLILGPAYIAVLAAPGYLYVWATRCRVSQVSVRTRWWVRTSLIVALLCSIYGTLYAGYWMILFAPPSLLSAFATARLMLLFERAGKS